MPGIRSDPHRRPLRHRYQEGPGFLFLATSGGRPPGSRVEEDLAGLRFRIRCVRIAHEEGIAAALALGAGRTSLYRWRQRYAAGGIEALRHERRGPTRERLPAPIERAVIVVRLLTYWNSKRLAAEFRRRDIYPLGHHAVDALLDEYGAARPGVHKPRGPAYERARPDELWHIDIKGPFWLRRSASEHTKVWIVGLVDDHSRFVIGLRVLPRPATEPILEWLGECLELVGIPLEVMSDIQTRSCARLLAPSAGDVRIRASGPRPSPLSERSERSATPCLLMMRMDGVSAGGGMALLGTR